MPPAKVERLRARLETRDALVVAVLAYAGLRPQELLALRWDDVVDGALRIRRKNVNVQLFPYTKTRQEPAREAARAARCRPRRVGAR